MRKIICFLMIFVLFPLFAACEKSNVPSESKKKAAINNVEYNSLTEAVESAKEGDTIKIYDDLLDHKNVVIDKPLTIKGVLAANQVKPKFYGSITINLPNEEDSVSIEDIDLIHDGVKNEGEGNDTRVGINVLDGGLELKKSKISVFESSQAPEAVGVVISRRAGSVNIMPFIIEGNSFDGYEIHEGELNSAMIIKSNKAGELEKLDLDVDKIYDENTFAHTREGNQMIFIDYQGGRAKYTYLATSSCDELLSALQDRQAEAGSTYRLTSFNPPKVMTGGKFYINPKTTLSFEGNQKPTLSGVTLIVSGTLNAETGLDGAQIERSGNTAYVMINNQ